MEQGWVYVLVNGSIPGCVKVGRTTKPPVERAAELSAATGVATPFLLVFEQLFEDCALAEQRVHAEFDRRGERVAPNREFFRTSPAEAVRVILAIASERGVEPVGSAVPVATQLLAQGDRFLRGDGDALQDLTDAVRCYRQAAQRGSAVAYERLGAIHAAFEAGPAGHRRALRYLKEGARRGNCYCYVEMAEIFAREKHATNFAKAWSLFFDAQAAGDVDDRFVGATQRYIGQCLAFGVAPAHGRALRTVAEPLIRNILASIDIVRDAPERHAKLTDMLRWCYEHLLPRQRCGDIRPVRPTFARFWLVPVRRAAA